jgi:hypothetical protein
MPFRHVVMFKWAEGVGDDHIDRVRAGLDVLALEIEQIRSYVHGSDVGVSVGNYDYALVADFDNVDDFRTYRDHPSHVLFIEELITGKVDDRAAVQFMSGGAHAGGDAAGASTRLPEASEESDEELLERARRTAMAEMQAMMSEPDATG